MTLWGYLFSLSTDEQWHEMLHPRAIGGSMINRITALMVAPQRFLSTSIDQIEFRGHMMGTHERQGGQQPLWLYLCRDREWS